MGNGRYKYMLLAGAIAGAIAVSVARPGSRFSVDRSLIQPIWFSLGLYAVFGIYWSIAAKDSAPAQTSEHWASTVLHQILVNASLLAIVIRVPGLTGRWLPDSIAFSIMGIAVQACGTLLAFWARRHLGSNWSAEVSAKVGHELVRSGPYRTLRHPIYTGMFLIHAGMTIASGEWHAVLGMGFLAITYARKIQLEEQMMDRTFGGEYTAYRQHSWALIPWVL